MYTPCSPCSLSYFMLSSAVGLCCQFVENNPLFYHQPGLFGDFYRIPLVHNLIECNPDPPLDSIPGSKSWPVEIPFSPSLGLVISIHFRESCEFQLNLVSTQHPHFESLPILEIFSCTISLHFPYLILPISIPTYSQYTGKIYSISSSWRDPYIQ